MYVCMYACMYVSMCVCMYVYKYSVDFIVYDKVCGEVVGVQAVYYLAVN